MAGQLKKTKKLKKSKKRRDVSAVATGVNYFQLSENDVDNHLKYTLQSTPRTLSQYAAIISLSRYAAVITLSQYSAVIILSQNAANHH